MFGGLKLVSKLCMGGFQVTLKEALEQLCKAIEGKWTDRGSTPPKELIGPLEMAKHVLADEDSDFDALLYAKLGVDRVVQEEVH